MNDEHPRGHNSNLNLQTLLTGAADALRAQPYVSITMIDSDPFVQAMRWVEERFDPTRGWIRRNPLTISGFAAVDLLEDRSLFTGFDEIWIAESPLEFGPPKTVGLTGPTHLGPRVPPELAAWSIAVGCRAGFGDGNGLNYLVHDEELAHQFGLQ